MSKSSINEISLVKEYILNQFASNDAVIETISTNEETQISVLKILEKENNIYVTLGASGYMITNKLRKDMQFFEFIVMSSKAITKEQERVIVDNLHKVILWCQKSYYPLGELHTIDLMSEGKPNLFNYSTFMMLRAAKPLELKNRCVQFMLALPLFAEESNWLDTEPKKDFLFSRNPAKVSREYTGHFLSLLFKCFAGSEIFYIDSLREDSSRCAEENVRLPFFETIANSPRWGDILKLARNMATSPFLPARSQKIQPLKRKTISKNWKYEASENEIVLVRYIGDDDEVIVPNTINEKTVVRLKYSAFSPENCKGFLYTRSNETLMTLRKVTLPTTITTIESEMFYGCSCLEEVCFSKNIKRIEPRAFTNCHSLKTTKYENGIYLGIKGNPYYALIEVEAKSTYICIHPDTKVIQQSAFVTYANPNLSYVEVPDGITNFFYKGDYPYMNPIFKVKKGTKASKFLLENKFNVELC